MNCSPTVHLEKPSWEVDDFCDTFSLQLGPTSPRKLPKGEIKVGTTLSLGTLITFSLQNLLGLIIFQRLDNEE
jgi:hypothetical protein